MTHKKLFAFDVDGTLLTNAKIIHPTTIQAIQKLKQKGHHVCLVSGRNFSQMIDFVRALELNDYTIAISGGLLQNLKTHGIEVFAKPLPHDIKKLAYRLVQETRRELAFCTAEATLWRAYFGDNLESDVQNKDYFIGGSSRIPIFDDPKTAIAALFSESILQITLKIESDRIQEYVVKAQQLLPPNIGVHVVSKVYLEIFDHSVNKYHTLQAVQQKLGVSNENTYAFGDSDNDLLMVEKVGHGVAMGNAVAHLKKIAKYVIGDNNTNSIAAFLKAQNLIS